LACSKPTIAPCLKKDFFIQKKTKNTSSQDTSHLISCISLIADTHDIVPDSYNPGKIKVIFTDSLRKSYRYISLTDLGFYNYAEKHARDNKIDELNNFIHRQQEVFLRVGLSREYKAPDGRKGFWL
jgi:hypothetical protein